MIHAQLMHGSGVQVVNVHFAVDGDSTQWARLPRAALGTAASRPHGIRAIIVWRPISPPLLFA